MRAKRTIAEKQPGRQRGGRAARSLGGLCLLVLSGCRPTVEPTAYVGDGTYEGSPPMCLQSRKESRPGPWQRSLLVHFNNTCDFGMDCLVYNDVTEQEQRVVVMPNGRTALLVAAASDESSFDIDLHCTWHE
jgi:hypothetical protein